MGSALGLAATGTCGHLRKMGSSSLGDAMGAYGHRFAGSLCSHWIWGLYLFLPESVYLLHFFLASVGCSPGFWVWLACTEAPFLLTSCRAKVEQSRWFIPVFSPHMRIAWPFLPAISSDWKHSVCLFLTKQPGSSGTWDWPFSKCWA